MGMERFLLLLKEHNFQIPDDDKTDLFIAYVGEEAKAFVIEIANDLRYQGIQTQIDLNNRSLKAQLKFADKIGAKNLIVVGEEELKNGKAKIKNMQTKQEQEFAFCDIIEQVMKIL